GAAPHPERDRGPTSRSTARSLSHARHSRRSSAFQRRPTTRTAQDRPRELPTTTSNVNDSAVWVAGIAGSLGRGGADQRRLATPGRENSVTPRDGGDVTRKRRGRPRRRAGGGGRTILPTRGHVAHLSMACPVIRHIGVGLPLEFALPQPDQQE